MLLSPICYWQSGKINEIHAGQEANWVIRNHIVIAFIDGSFFNL